MRIRLRRAEQTAETRRRLLEAAQRVFVARGFFDASLDQVAEEAGLTKGAVYSRFESKGDLFLALYEERVAARFEELQLVPDRAATPEAAAAMQMRRWLELMRADPAWALLVTEFRVYAARRPELNARYAALHGRLRDAVAAALAERFAEAGLESPIPLADVARVALAVGAGATLARCAEGAAFDDTVIERMVGGFMRDLVAGARPARRPARRNEPPKEASR